MTVNDRDFTFDTNYNPQSAFTRIKYGIDKPLLETELNEMQKIQEEARASLIRQIVPTGFLEVVRKDFIGSPIIYNPNNLDNCIAIAPAKLIVNGYELTLEGKDKVDGVDGYTIINLGDAPFDAVNYYDFVFMEVWFEELNFESNVNKYGFIDGLVIKNNMVDERVNDETSRRVALRYKIRVQKGVNIDKWPYGFGFNNITDFSNIYASGPKSAPIQNSNYLFISATNPIFKDAPFYGDNGLFVASRPGNTSSKDDFGVLDNYIYGVPLLAVKRRNQKPYSILEPNGASKYTNSIIASTRPDGLFYNRIVERDLKDLRKTISFGQFNITKLLDSGLKQLVTGELKTKSKEIVERIQFGITPIDISNRSDVILNAQFNKSIVPLLGPIPTSTGTLKYDLCATGYGVVIDGQTTISYKPSPVINWIDKDSGSIEFFIKPFWDGGDTEINQTIFSITDDSNNIIMSLKKEGGNLALIQRQNANENSDINKTIAILNNYKVNNKGIYHIRVTWDRNVNKTTIYINGQEAGFGTYLLSALIPTTFKIGEIETVGFYSSNNVGFVIDELLIYNRVIEEVFPQVDFDIASGYAKLYQSFNGVLRSFKDNYHVQKDLITSVVTVNGTNNFDLNAPYGTTISSTVPVVYNPTNGNVYSGTWSGLNTTVARFTLNGSMTPNGTTQFTGETVWVKYDINVPGGNGIDNIPKKILKAEMGGKEVSFAKESENFREVRLINQDGSFELNHTAFDYNSTRNGKDAYARVIRYVIESNGTNKYIIPSTLYGFDVIGIKYVDRALSSIRKLPTGEFEINLQNTVAYNDTFSVEVATAGYTFEYEPHSKSIVSNMLQAKTVTITATGDTNTFKIPTYTGNGGVVVSLLETYDLRGSINNDFGPAVYLDGQQVAVNSIGGIGTPFIEVTFPTNPQLNKVIEIPVLVTYQPVTSDKLSIWYEYIPYQGILDNKQKILKRLSDWKVFCTTLGSGNIFVEDIKENSINNASNRLPGGQKLSYTLTGIDINFIGESFTDDISYKSNKKFRIVDNVSDIVIGDKFDEYFTILDSDLVIQKLYGDSQDSKLAPPFSNKGFYIKDTSPITKYLGAACLVIDDMGNILLLVIGQIKADPVSQSVLKATYGDLFKLESSPILITKRY